MLQGLGFYILPLLCGYWFLTNCNFTKYRSLRDSGYHVLFRSTIMGLALFVLSNLVLKMVEYVFPENPLFLKWQNWLPIENAAALSLTVFFAGISPIVFNQFYSENKAARNVAKQKGNHLEQLIDHCINQQLLVELSLHSGKCYIGYILESQLTWPSEFDIPLVPIASGYRNKETLELEITTHYSSIIQEFKGKDRDKFRIVIPMSQIVSARQFDQKVYARFQDMKSSVDGTENN